MTTLRVFVGALVALAMVLVPVRAASGATNVYYLRGDGVPTGGLSLNLPPAGSLPNYDPGRDEFPGLKLAKTNQGAAETDPSKYQLWFVPSGSIELAGAASLTVWSAMKDFDRDKAGSVTAFLLDCNSSGAGCTVIGQGTSSASPWSGSDTWVPRTISFGSIAHTIAADRALAIKLVVDDQSGDDMWFAYDTASYPSALSVERASTQPTTTTMTATTATTSAATTSSTGSTVTTAPLATTTATGGPSTTTSTPSQSEGTGGGRGDEAGSGGAPGPPTSTPASGESGESVQAEPIDRSLQPLAAPLGGGGVGNHLTTTESGLALTLMEGLELVVPPGLAAAILSPLLILEFLLRAVADSFRAVTVPAVLLGLLIPWALSERRLFALTRRRSANSSDPT